MKTQLAILLIGSGILFPLCLLSSNRDLSPWRFILIASISFVLSQLVINEFFEILNIRRGNSFLHVLRGLKPVQKENPIILILGSSYTARNIDGVFLEQELNLAGLNFQVHQMSYPGSYAYEQDYFLDQYLLEFPAPDIVIVELGTEHSLTIKPENHLKHQTIEFNDLKRVNTLIYGIVNQESNTPLDSIFSVVSHGLARGAHLGILHAMEPRQNGPLKLGFVPEKSGDNPPKKDEIQKGLFAELSVTPVHDYRVQFRKQQYHNLIDRGVKHVIYWQPPSVDKEQRLRTTTLCRALSFNCIEFDAPELLNGPFWTDKSHLNDKGAGLLTGWLASHLIEKKEIHDVF